MTVELLQTLSLVSFIIAGVIFLIGVALFFLLDVPKLYGDVSGRTAKKAIEAIRQQNESSGNKAYKPSAVNAERGKITDKITQSGRLQSQTAGLPVSVGTEKISTSGLHPQSNETTVLSKPAGETTVLNQPIGETTVLNQPAGETTVLNQPAGKAAVPDQPAGDTTALVNEEAPNSDSDTSDKFTVDVEMSFTGSSELIE